MSAARVAVFIDYQNCYGWARRAFHDPSNDPPIFGHVVPRKLADLIVSMARDRALTYAGVYVGLPNPQLDPKTSSARAKQMAAWRRTGLTVVARPIRYPRNWPKTLEKPIEKGVDVKLALDAVMMAIANHFDVGVVASLDSDLVPVAEALVELNRRRGTPEVEVIRWEGVGSRIRVPGEQLVEREITRVAYASLQDMTDYTI